MELSGLEASERSEPVIVGESDWTVALRAEIARAATFSSDVLVTGPSGSGKELVARSLHTQSSRRREPFIPVDCASVDCARVEWRR